MDSLTSSQNFFRRKEKNSLRRIPKYLKILLNKKENLDYLVFL